MKVEIEVDRLDQLSEVLEVVCADVVLLDEAVSMAGGRLRTEASGNLRLDRVAAVAATDVEHISPRALTRSASTLDLGLDI